MPAILIVNPNTSARTTAMLLAVARAHLPPGTAVRRGRAVIVAAFGDPGAGRLRVALSVPVIGIGEAAIREAAAGGRRFGIATTTPALERAIAAMVTAHGVAASFTGLRLPEADPLALAADPSRQDAALGQAVRDCLDRDGAEVVVIGGGPLSESAARLHGQYPGAIIEPLPAALRALPRVG